MKRYVQYLLSALLVCSPLSLMAQEEEVDAAQSDDVEVWTGIEMEKKLSKKLSVGLEGEMRSRSNASEFDRFSLSPSVEYKILKHLKASVGGSVITMNNPAKDKYRSDNTLKWHRDSYWAPRYRGYAALTGDVDLGRWNISLRERYQVTYRPESSTERYYYLRDGRFNYSEEDVSESKTTQVLRSRLLASYDIRHCPIAPFAGAEITNDISDFALDKIRYTIGADWKANKSNTVSLVYIYQDVKADDGEDDVNSHIISISYKHKF